jgi:hypothetical protein
MTLLTQERDGVVAVTVVAIVGEGVGPTVVIGAEVVTASVVLLSGEQIVHQG